jgi:hypothetical protein
MNTPDPLSRIPVLYHFTDLRNLPLIRQLGGLLPMAELVRRKVEIPAPGGNDWSRSADAMFGMDRFVHLCFRNNHPMAYLAKEAGHLSEVIYLQINPTVLQMPGVMFTPDVSNKSGVTPCTIDQARTMIDYEVLFTWTNWSDPAILQRLRQAEKCEILVPNLIPLELIRGFPDG